MQILSEPSDEPFHKHPNQHFLSMNIIVKPRTLLKTVVITELRLLIFTTMGNRMFFAYRYFKKFCHPNFYSESLRTGKPVFHIVDNMISYKTKPSSEDVYFHQSSLK